MNENNILKAGAAVNELLPKQPFALGAREQVFERLAGQFSRTTIRRAMMRIARRGSYQLALIQSPHRYGIDGETGTGEAYLITDRQRSIAKKSLKRIQNKSKAEKKKKQQPPPKPKPERNYGAKTLRLKPVNVTVKKRRKVEVPDE